MLQAETPSRAVERELPIETIQLVHSLTGAIEPGSPGVRKSESFFEVIWRLSSAHR